MRQSMKPISFLALAKSLGTSAAVATEGPKTSAQAICHYFNQALQNITTLPSENSYANLSAENWLALLMPLIPDS